MKRSLGHLSQVVKGFLAKYSDGRSPLLIAYSGGPDSKALLYAVREWAHVPLHVAHVDHGWREESRAEALGLQKEVEALGLAFHTLRLDGQTTEDKARSARLAFFHTLRQTISFQAVLLGHQADDLAETVLKRLFEGSHLTSLGGMQPVSTFAGLPLWRPLLQIAKSEIEAALSQAGLDFLRDATNGDPRYLRARMRTQLVPYLSELFGKEIRSNLVALSARAHELEKYLQQRISLKQAVKGPLGWWVDGKTLCRIELRHLLLQVAKEEGLTLTRQVLETVLDWVYEAGVDKKISLAGREMIVDRGHFFLLTDKRVEWVVETGVGPASEEGWPALWRGEARLRGLRGLEKAPAFLRRLIPLCGEERKNIKIFIREVTPAQDSVNLSESPLGQFNPILL